MIEVIPCPSCQRKRRLPDSVLGQEVVCPVCQDHFFVPDVRMPAPAPGMAPAVEVVAWSPPPAEMAAPAPWPIDEPGWVNNPWPKPSPQQEAAEAAWPAQRKYLVGAVFLLMAGLIGGIVLHGAGAFTPKPQPSPPRIGPDPAPAWQPGP